MRHSGEVVAILRRSPVPLTGNYGALPRDMCSSEKTSNVNDLKVAERESAK